MFQDTVYGDVFTALRTAVPMRHTALLDVVQTEKFAAQLGVDLEEKDIALGVFLIIQRLMLPSSEKN